MRKFCLSILISIFAVTAAMAQGTGTHSRKEYQSLIQQREELLSWESEHQMAPKIVAVYKKNEAKKIREQLYSDFFSFRVQDIAAYQAQLRQELAKNKNIPFVTRNTLPAENLQKMTGNKDLLIAFLRSYPDNAINLSETALTNLFKENETLENILVYYLLYLKNINNNPSCSTFTETQQKQLSSFLNAGNQEALFRSLFSYTNSCRQKRQKTLSQKYVRHSLACAFR